MWNSSDRGDRSVSSEERSDPRRPYAKPRIVYREPLEAVAADCSIPNGKSDPTCIVGFS